MHALGEGRQLPRGREELAYSSLQEWGRQISRGDPF